MKHGGKKTVLLLVPENRAPGFRYGFVEDRKADYASIDKMMEAAAEGCGIRCH